MSSFVRFLACRRFSNSSVWRGRVEQISQEYVDKVRQRTRFSETSAFQGHGGAGGNRRAMADPFDTDAAFANPFYIASYYDSDQFINLRFGTIITSFAVLFIYLAWIRESNDLDKLWSFDMRLVYIVAKKRVVRDQIEQAKKNGRSTLDLENSLIDLEVQEETLRAEEAKKMEKEAQKK